MDDDWKSASVEQKGQVENSSKQDFFNEEPIKIQRTYKIVTVGTENKEYFHNALFQDESKINGELITRESESRCHRY